MCNTERDFETLELVPPEIREEVKQARIQARKIKDQIDPGNINSWAELIQLLEVQVHTAKQFMYQLSGPKTAL